MKRKLLCQYSDYNTSEEEFEYRKKHWSDFFGTKPSDEQIRQSVYDDSDIYRFAWEDFLNYLDEIMDEIQDNIKSDNYFWLDLAKGMTWRNLKGSKSFKASLAAMLISEISPDTDCSFEVYSGGKTFFQVRISSHDVPTGEWHRISAISEKKFNKLNE